MRLIVWMSDEVGKLPAFGQEKMEQCEARPGSFRVCTVGKCGVEGLFSQGGIVTDCSEMMPGCDVLRVTA